MVSVKTLEHGNNSNMLLLLMVTTVFLKITLSGSGEHLLRLLVYVEDILITWGNQCVINIGVTILNRQFALKDLGAVNFFLDFQAVKHWWLSLNSTEVHC